MEPKTRTWLVDGEPETGIVNPGEVVNLMIEAGQIVARIGGVVNVAVERAQDRAMPDLWHTTRVVVRWESFVPGKRAEPKEKAEPVVEAIPEDEIPAQVVELEDAVA